MAPGLDIGPVLLLLLAAEGGPQQGRRRASVGGAKGLVPSPKHHRGSNYS